MGFHPKNGLHQVMKVRLSIWTFWNCVKNCKRFKEKLKNVKTGSLKLEINNEEIYFEDLGH